MALLIPTVHPATVLRGGRQVSDVIASDLGKAWRISNEGPKLEEHLIWVLPGNPIGIVKAKELALAWMQHWRRKGARVGVDVETSALDFFNCKLYSIAIAEAEDSNTGIAFTLCDFHTLPFSFERELEHELKLLLSDTGVEKVFHNAPFDMAVLHHKKYPVRGPIHDTQGLHHLVQPDLPHHLGWVGHTYLDVEPWKLTHQSGKMANTNDPVELLVYNIRDALYTAMLVEPLQRSVRERGMSNELMMWQSEFAQLATDMEIAGMPINRAKRQAMGIQLRDKVAHATAEMRSFLGWPDFNPMSSRHRSEALFGEKYAKPPWNLGLKPQLFSEKTGAPSTSYKSVIDSLEHPFVKWLTTAVETQQTYATQYADGTNRGINGKIEKPGAFERAIIGNRIYPRWKCNVLNSSRFGSEPNVQNIRVIDRAYMECAPGRVMISADKDQLELRIAACRAGVRELMEEMAREDGDPHSLAARHVYGDEFLKRSKDERKLLRGMVKNVTYASLYLAGVITVWRTIRNRKQLDPVVRAKMTLPVVRHIHQSYFGRYMEFPRWHEADLKFINDNGYIEIPPLGRRRYCPVKPAPATEFSNWKVQCYTEGMKIHTPEGLLDIIECNNRQVFVPGTGTSAEASLVKKGHASLLEVRLSDGSAPLTVTEDHQWLCQDDETYHHKKASELTPGDLVCTELPAGSTLRPTVEVKDWPYWLGALTSDGATTQSQYDLFFGTSKNKRDAALPDEYFRFAISRGWVPRKPRQVKNNLVVVKAGDTVAGRQRFREDMELWGYDRNLACKHKRVPQAVFTSGHWGIRRYLLGMLNADGAQTSCPPSPGRSYRHDTYGFHMANRELLEQLQMLCSYMCIESRLIGPLTPNPDKPYISWRLDLHPYDVESVLLGQRAPTRQRSRQSRGPLTPRSTCQAFLDSVPSRPFKTGSAATLHHRLRAGGRTTAWTLRELYRRLGVSAPPLYNAVPVLSVKETCTTAPVYTLSVDHPLHRYLAQGTVTKNCLGADVVTMEMAHIKYELQERFEEAYVIHHGHDQVTVECRENDAEAVEEVVNRHFGATPLDGPAGRVYLTGAAKVGKDFQEVK